MSLDNLLPTFGRQIHLNSAAVLFFEAKQISPSLSVPVPPSVSYKDTLAYNQIHLLSYCLYCIYKGPAEVKSATNSPSF